MLKAVAASSGGGAASGITIGTSVITGGTDKRLFYDNNGVVGETAQWTYNNSTGLLLGNMNAAAAPAAISGTGLQIVGADAAVGRVASYSFGAIAAFTVARANGTGATPTAIVSGDQLGGFNSYGYRTSGGAAYSGPSSSVQSFATENWTSTANGTKIVLATTPNTSTTLTTGLTIDQDQSVAMAGRATIATSLAIGGATIGSNALAVTGASALAGQLTNILGTITTSQPFTTSQTWNAAGVTFIGEDHNYTDTASAAGSLAARWQVGGQPAIQITKAGVLQFGTINNTVNPTIQFYFGSGGSGLGTLSGTLTAESAGALTYFSAGVRAFQFSSNAFTSASLGIVGWAPAGDTRTAADAMFTRAGVASIQSGAQDAAVAVAQTTRVQSVVAGTAAANGANWTLIGSLPTGTGTSGDIIFQTGVKTGSGTTQGTATTALTIKGETQAITIAAGKQLVLGNSAATGLAAGVLAALTNASIVITDASGQAYRVPCII